MIYNTQNTEFIFYCLERCEGVKQLINHHPEGDVFTHSLQVLHYSFRETDDTDLILAAMLHDVGKAVIGKGHEKESVILLENHASTKTLFLIEHHMRFWEWVEGDMHKLGKCKFLAEHPWLPELAQLARWDNKGRKAGWIPKYNKQEIIDRLNEKAEKHFKEAPNDKTHP